MTTFKKNPNGMYALYESGSEWRESATVKNDELNGSDYSASVDGTYTTVADLFMKPPYLLPGESIWTPPIWKSTNWSVTIDGETRTLKPTPCLTPFELYNITVWKEECQANIYAEPVKFKERAIELDIWKYFTS